MRCLSPLRGSRKPQKFKAWGNFSFLSLSLFLFSQGRMPQDVVKIMLVFFTLRFMSCIFKEVFRSLFLRVDDYATIILKVYSSSFTEVF